MPKNVFVLGLTPLQREELNTVHGGGDLVIHELLDHEVLVDEKTIDFDALWSRAGQELDAFDGSVDGIVSHWDFPTSVLGPVLAAERGLPAPSLTSILRCERKYWSRLEQRAAVPEVVPGFVAFDPFAADDVAAQEVIEGVQFAPEGSVCHGSVTFHGVVDMHKDPSELSIERIDYPASLITAEVQQRALDATERLLRHIGFDDGCFNSEFMWDEATDTLRIIEVNTRISQSHSELFALVDGRSNHQAAVDVAFGHVPRMPERRGDLAVAAQHAVVHGRDAIVRAVPNEAVLRRIAERYPGTRVEFAVAPGDRLSTLPHQDSYRYELAVVHVGAPDRDALRARIEDIEQMLQFDLEDCGEGRT